MYTVFTKLMASGRRARHPYPGMVTRRPVIFTGANPISHRDLVSPSGGLGVKVTGDDALSTNYGMLSVLAMLSLPLALGVVTITATSSSTKG